MSKVLWGPVENDLILQRSYFEYSLVHAHASCDITVLKPKGALLSQLSLNDACAANVWDVAKFD